MKKRQLERNKKSNGKLKEKSQIKRQNDEYSDIQGQRMKQCIKLATPIFFGILFLLFIYFFQVR
jgi:hypothetical protein